MAEDMMPDPQWPGVKLHMAHSELPILSFNVEHSLISFYSQHN
jgi:hypothetical protein